MTSARRRRSVTLRAERASTWPPAPSGTRSTTAPPPASTRAHSRSEVALRTVSYSTSRKWGHPGARWSQCAAREPKQGARQRLPTSRAWQGAAVAAGADARRGRRTVLSHDLGNAEPFSLVRDERIQRKELPPRVKRCDAPAQAALATPAAADEHQVCRRLCLGVGSADGGESGGCCGGGSGGKWRSSAAVASSGRVGATGGAAALATLGAQRRATARQPRRGRRSTQRQRAAHDAGSRRRVRPARARARPERHGATRRDARQRRSGRGVPPLSWRSLAGGTACQTSPLPALRATRRTPCAAERVQTRRRA